MSDDEELRATLEALSVRLADEGKLIESGWVSLRATCMAADAPAVQVREMQMAFMAGAQHLYASMMTVLDPGDEPSLADLKRLALVDAELRAFDAELRRWARLAP